MAHEVHQLLFSAKYFVLNKFSMPNDSHMDAHRIYDLTVVHLFKCIFDIGPRTVNMLQARATFIRHWFELLLLSFCQFFFFKFLYRLDLL